MSGKCRQNVQMLALKSLFCCEGPQLDHDFKTFTRSTWQKKSIIVSSNNRGLCSRLSWPASRLTTLLAGWRLGYLDLCEKADRTWLVNPFSWNRQKVYFWVLQVHGCPATQLHVLKTGFAHGRKLGSSGHLDPLYFVGSTIYTTCITCRYMWPAPPCYSCASRGDTAELFFDRSKLHPRGMSEAHTKGL